MAGQHLGILLIEFGVGVTVAAVMTTLFYMLRRLTGAERSGGRWTFLGHYNYWIVIALMMVGLYTVAPSGNLVKKVIGLNIFQASQCSSSSSPSAKVSGGTAPIVAEGWTVYSNPLPHVLILTAIVVGVATTAVGLALIVRINRAYAAIEDEEIRRSDLRDPP